MHLKTTAAFLLLLLSVSAPALLTGCTDDEVWGENRDDLVAQLVSGDHEFLRHIDYQSVRISDVGRLGPGAGYYLAVVYRSLGLDGIAASLAEHELSRGDTIWDREAGLLLAELHLSNREYEQALAVGSALARRFPADEAPPRLVAHSLYELGRHEELLDHIGDVYGDLPSRALDPEGTGIRSIDAEVVLWWLVARCELDRPGWSRDFARFVRNVDVASEHGRLSRYVFYRPEVAAEISEIDLELFRAKQLIDDGEPSEGFARLAAVLADEGESGGTVFTPALARDLSRAAYAAGQLVHAAGLLESAAVDEAPRIPEAREREQAGAEASRATDGLRWALLFESGRLYRWAGAYSRATAVLHDAARIAPPEVRERTTWYYLSSIVRHDPKVAVTEVSVYAKRFENPRYFADLFEELVAALAERREWELLWLLHEATEDYTSDGMASQLQVLIARLVSGGVIEVGDARRMDFAAQLLDQAASQTENMYYRLIAAAILGREFELSDAAPSEQSPVVPESEESPRFEDLVMGYFDYGLFAEAYRRTLVADERLPLDAMIEVGDRLSRRGMVDEALRIHAAAARRTEYPPEEEIARRLYPRGFPSTVRSAAEANGLPASVLFAVIREESYFDPEAVSSAGAVGLAQIMPETAADLAARMRITDELDLTDAVTSIRMGSYYLGNLAERFQPISRALAAYNAGQGRVRRWEVDRAGLDSFLFVETIPFAETRGYIRKVLVSAVFYGYVYEQIAAEATIRGFFPDL